VDQFNSGANLENDDDDYNGFELFTQMARANNKLVQPAKAAKKRKTAHATGR
jgi:hypothetical protein